MAEEADERSEAERFNDEHIAPELARLSKLAREHGLNFVARVEWAPFDGQTTMSKVEGISASHELAWFAAQANGNVDAVLMSLARSHHAGTLDCSASMLSTYMNLGPFRPKQAPADGGSNDKP